jgi:hypothetical protein
MNANLYAALSYQSKLLKIPKNSSPSGAHFYPVRHKLSPLFPSYYDKFRFSKTVGHIPDIFSQLCYCIMSRPLVQGVQPTVSKCTRKIKEPRKRRLRPDMGCKRHWMDGWMDGWMDHEQAII